MLTRRMFVQSLSAAAVGTGTLTRALQTGPQNEISDAMASDRAAMPIAESDPYRPLYHFHPPANHMNDPNGTIFFEGWHHLFYQHDPYAPRWGSIHWGHARSRDLVNWQHLPIALAPSLNQGEMQCFSGGAILAGDGLPRLLYTSIGRGMPMHPEQWLAIPADRDLIRWKKYAKNPVIRDSIHGNLRVEDWRDPFMFKHLGQVYAVCGGNASRRANPGTGEVLLYRALNSSLTEWEFLRVIFHNRSSDVINIECPNLFQLDGRWVLIISPHRPCEYLIGDFDPREGEFKPTSQGVLDPGHAYATNISFDDQKRTLLWIWGQAHQPESHGWIGCLAMPRILSIGADGFLRQLPAPEFKQLRKDPISVAPFPLTKGKRTLDAIHGECLEIEATVSAGNAKYFGFEFRRSGTGKAGLLIAFRPGDATLQVGDITLVVGRRKTYNLHIFLDRCVAEVYINGGEHVVLATIMAPPQDLGAAFFAEGSDHPSGDPYFPDETTEPAKLISCTVWPMKPAIFDASRFV